MHLGVRTPQGRLAAPETQATTDRQTDREKDREREDDSIITII